MDAFGVDVDGSGAGGVADREGLGEGVGVPASAMAFSSAATVAASTVPVAGTSSLGLELLERLRQGRRPPPVDGAVPEAGEP